MVRLSCTNNILQQQTDMVRLSKGKNSSHAMWYFMRIGYEFILWFSTRIGYEPFIFLIFQIRVIYQCNSGTTRFQLKYDMFILLYSSRASKRHLWTLMEPLCSKVIKEYMIFLPMIFANSAKTPPFATSNQCNSGTTRFQLKYDMFILLYSSRASKRHQSGYLELSGSKDIKKTCVFFKWFCSCTYTTMNRVGLYLSWGVLSVKMQSFFSSQQPRIATPNHSGVL